MEQKIVRATFPLSKELTPQEAEVIVSQQSPRVRDCSENELSKVLLDAITKAYFQTGQSMNVLNISLESKDLVHDLIKYFPTVFIKEIDVFFKQGIDELFGQYFGLNCKTYRQWLRGGVTNANRLSAMKKQNLYMIELNKPKELTQSQKDKIIRDGVSVAFENYKKTKQLLDFGNVNYNLLDKLKLIPLTIERKKEFYKQAERTIREGLSKSLLNCKESKIKTIKDELENMNVDKIKSEAKNLALADFFNSLIETGTELKDLIK